MTWQQIPFVRFLFPLLLGIIVYSLLGNFMAGFVSISFLLFFILALFFVAKGAIPDFKSVRNWGAVLNLGLIVLGYTISYANDIRNHKNYLSDGLEEAQHSFVVTIQEQPQLKQNSIQALLKVEAEQDSNAVLNAATGNLLAYFQIDTLSVELEYGDRLLVNTRINSINKPLNPNAFDAQKYYKGKNIFHQSYIKEGHWHLLEREQRSALYSFLIASRERLLSILKQKINTPNEYAVASALILGAKGDLSSSIKNAYADTGAMHVLAVSGLHVGILILIISFLLDLVKTSNRNWRRFKVVFLLLVLWSFALLTGASSSVLRASTMFSFVLGGQLLNRKINIYNSLAASAFCLLCYNPLMLYDVGFQLSYLALIGIVYLHPKLYKLWYIPNKLGDWIWNGIAVSLAAQIATLPISLYYFHQFPVYFWLTGILVTAVAGLILGLGLGLLFFSKIPVLGALIAKLLWVLIWGMNSIIFVIQKLPGAVWEGFWLEYWEMGLCYLLLLGLLFVWKNKELKWLAVPLSICLILGINRGYKLFLNSNQQLLCVYNTRKSTLISYIDGKNSWTLADASLLGSPQIAYAQQNHLWALGIPRTEIYNLEDSLRNSIIQYSSKKGIFNKQRLFLYSEKENNQKSHSPLEVDYVLVHGNPKMKSIEEIEDLCLYKKLIFDASNSFWNVEKWVKECNDLGIDYINVSKDGAWVKEL